MHLDFTGPESIVKLMIKNGADVNAVDHFSDSPLLLAIYKGNTQKFVESLCDLQIFF